MNRSEDFFTHGIVSKTGGFGRRPIIPETRVVTLEQLRGGRKHLQAHGDHLDSVVARGQFVDISKATINRILHGPKYMQITKASLTFPTKVWWEIVRVDLRPSANDNILSPSLASLVACLMDGYPLNVDQIITINMLDRALNERAGFTFPCLIGKLCLKTNIPPNKLVDRWVEASRVIATSKIEDAANHLCGAKAGAVGQLAVVPHVPIDIPQRKY
ncbi:hypothetical protein KY284_015041 [Solanum tuberosum]|nr:hypothetical protein KY284_015041 [Solanum tuberosum]